MNAYRAQQIAIAAAIERGDYEHASDLLRQDVRTFAQPPPQIEPEQPGTTGHDTTLTPRRRCGIIKSIRRKMRRTEQIQEVSKMDKVKIWSVCVNHVTWSRPRTLYFCSKQAAQDCYNGYEYADKPRYIGAYSRANVAAAIDTDPSNVPRDVVLLYYRSYAEYTEHK